MIDSLQWLVALEVLGLAFLPLTVWALRALPDRGYIFARILGLLLVTYITWLVGNVLPVGGSPVMPVMVLLVAAAIGWWTMRQETVAALRDVIRVVAVEEVLFLAAFVVWALLRVNTFGTGIQHTEQFMDMAFLNASYHSVSYPPYDPWMSGQTINYYYFGYLAFATLARISSVAPAVAFNLANCTLFALTLAGAYSIGYTLCRRVSWSFVAPIFVGLIGNWHAILWQLWHSGCPQTSTFFYNNFWPSTRVIGAGYNLAGWGACGGKQQPTITEYPLFSFVLADLHPHVMALPFALLAIALAAGLLFGGNPLVVERRAGSIARLLFLAVSVGSLFTINSWDFPTYSLVLAGAIAAVAYIREDSRSWWRRPLLTIVTLGIVSVVLFAPFYMHFHSLAHGIGRVNTPSDLFEFVQIFGLFLLAGGVLVVSLALLLQPATEEELEEPEPALMAESGEVRAEFASSDLLVWLLVGAAAVIFALVLHLVVLVLLLCLGGATLFILRRVLNTDVPNHADALALIILAVGCLVLILPEVIYIRDSFDLSTLYRMNTVFKFYYQGWVLLGLAGAYGVFRAWSILRAYFAPVYGWLVLVVVAAGTLAAAIYTIWLPSASVADSAHHTLDGSAWISTADPGDHAAIRWFRHHVSGHPVILEASGGEYTSAAIISTFTGLPSVMGWAGHEDQWRGPLPSIQTRNHDVSTIYNTTNASMAEGLLRQYHVRYVVVAEQERTIYPHSHGLTKFGRFMRAAYRAPGVTIYTW